MGGGRQESGYRTEIKEINKSDIGKTFTNDFNIWQISSISDLNGVYIVTFEYDWWASKKTIFWNTYTVCKCARMKFEHEWYQKFYFSVTSGITVTNNSKGHIKIKM